MVQKERLPRRGTILRGLWCQTTTTTKTKSNTKPMVMSIVASRAPLTISLLAISSPKMVKLTRDEKSPVLLNSNSCWVTF